jgi:hypothetical protein
LSFEGNDLNLYSYVWNDPVNFIDPEGTGLLRALAISASSPATSRQVLEGAAIYCPYLTGRRADSFH